MSQGNDILSYYYDFLSRRNYIVSRSHDITARGNIHTSLLRV